MNETMNETERDLWSRIQRYNFDKVDSELPFSKRLARENGWTLNYAKRVVEEYKRFAFLAVVANHPVTPSDEVDQAWHLHLIYTQSYWEEFCGDVLRVPLHHHPTKGGKAEGDKFRDWYARTKESYRKIFGEEPPRDIWKDERERFELAPHFRRINAKTNWIIPKPKINKRLSGVIAAGVALAIALWSCASDGIKMTQGAIVGVLVMLAGLAVVALIAFASNNPVQDERRKDGEGGSGCGGGAIYGGTDSHHNGDDGSGGGDSGCGGSGCGGGGCGGGGCGG